MKYILLVTILLHSTLTLLIAQPRTNQSGNPQPAEIVGTVIDKDSDWKLEYAQIVLFNSQDSLQVTGTVTNREGVFSLLVSRPGDYFLDVTFLGYDHKVIDNLSVERGPQSIDLGVITLNQAAIEMDGAEVSIQRAPVEYHIDKKVISVDKQPTAASGTAIDILENVPSVAVDVEGNVSLRGSENFMVLIDSRPTLLEPAEALQQIPASSIENIEIVTNPSAKYDPDGTSGIINVILKKNKVNGSNGVANISIGSSDQYSGDVIYSRKSGRLSTTLGLDYRMGTRSGESISKNWQYRSDTTWYNNTDGESDREYERYGMRASFDYNVTDKDLISIGTHLGYRSMESTSDLNADQWTIPGTGVESYRTNGSWGRSGNSVSTHLEYQHTFDRKKHQVTARAVINHRSGDEDSRNEEYDASGVVQSGKIAFEDGPSDVLEAKLDYTLPISETGNFETGYQLRSGVSEDVVGMSQYDPASGSYVPQPLYSHSIEYNRDIHSVYAMFSDEVGNFGYQGGLRGEFTNRTIELVGENQQFTIDRNDLYPTAHFSYNLPSDQQVMASYTRRISRTRGWYLEPFQTWSDAYNVRQGNPSLEPEYIDSYEAGYHRNMNRFQFSAEGYYRITHNLVEHVRSVYPDKPGVTLRSVKNVGKDYTSGMELMVEGNIFDWWNMNYMYNVYQVKIEGELFGTDYSNESNSWNSRINNSFKLTPDSKIQLNGIYNSDRATSQGQEEGSFVTNLALQMQFIDRSLTAIVQVNDIFSTSTHNYISEGNDFYSSSEYYRDAPTFSLTLRYNINNYRADRKSNSSSEVGDDDF